MSEQEEAQRKAAQASQNYENVRSLATTLNKDDGSVSCELLKGVVTAYTYPYLSVQVGGDTSTTITNIRHWESYTPVVGDTCNLLKQGSDIVAVARINTTTATPGLNGWIQPTLAAGFSHSADPIRYRVINDAGEPKLQFRGSCTASGVTYTSGLATLFTLPAGSRPATNRSMILRRDAGGLFAGLNFLSSTGVVQIDNMIGIASNSVQHGNLDTTSVNMQHWHNEVGGGATGEAKYGAWPSSYTNGFPGGNPHYHITESATHSHVFNVVPSALWLTGVELFLA